MGKSLALLLVFNNKCRGTPIYVGIQTNDYRCHNAVLKKKVLIQPVTALLLSQCLYLTCTYIPFNAFNIYATFQQRFPIPLALY